MWSCGCHIVNHYSEYYRIFTCRVLPQCWTAHSVSTKRRTFHFRLSAQYRRSQADRAITLSSCVYGLFIPGRDLLFQRIAKKFNLRPGRHSENITEIHESSSLSKLAYTPSRLTAKCIEQHYVKVISSCFQVQVNWSLMLETKTEIKQPKHFELWVMFSLGHYWGIAPCSVLICTTEKEQVNTGRLI